jgi:hypothetical protein
MRKMALWLVICGLLRPGMLLACPEDALALRYLDAIENMQWQRMRSFLATDARYTDPTMIYFGRDAIDIRGGDGIVAFWRSSSEDSGTSQISYETTACFETAGYHVVNLDISITVGGRFWNVNRPEIVLPGKVLSVIRVVDGRVVEHHDYVEYSNADRVVAELQEKYGKADPDTGEAN